MVLRARAPRRSAISSWAGPKTRRKSLARNLPSLLAAIAVIAFTDPPPRREDVIIWQRNWKTKDAPASPKKDAPRVRAAGPDRFRRSDGRAVHPRRRVRGMPPSRYASEFAGGRAARRGEARWSRSFPAGLRADGRDAARWRQARHCATAPSPREACGPR